LITKSILFVLFIVII